MGSIFETLVGTAVLGVAAYFQGKELEEKGEKVLQKQGICPDDATRQEKIQAGTNKVVEDRKKQLENIAEKKKKEMEREKRKSLSK